MYKNIIDKDMLLQLNIMQKQIDGVIDRQTQVLDGFLKSKERIIEQTGQITSGIIENMSLNYSDTMILNNSREDNNLIASNQDRLLLEDFTV